MRYNNKAGWRIIGGKKIYARSCWEANFARWLQWQKENGLIYDWEHEPKTFWFEGIKRGCVSYKPDFRVFSLVGEERTIDHYWVEVKGWMDPKSATKIKRFRKYFPEEKLVVVDKKWFAHNSVKLKLIIKDWEIGNAPQKRQKQKDNFWKH